MKCGKCGCENIDNSKFCESCGERLVAKCSECNADNPPKARFCEQCGATISGASRTSASPTPKPVVTSPTPKTAPPQAIPVAKPDGLPKKGNVSAGVIIVTLIVAGMGGYFALRPSAHSTISASAVPTATQGLQAPPSAPKPAEPALGSLAAFSPVPSSPEVAPNYAPAQTLVSQAAPLLQAILEGAKVNDETAIMTGIEAMKRLTLPARGNRKVARAANDVGLSALKNSSYEEAIGKFTEAIQADPADQEVMNNLGYALMMAGKQEEAKTAFQNALTLAPTRSSAWGNLALTLNSEGKKEDGFAAYMLAFKFSQNQQKMRDFIAKQSQEDSDPKVRELAGRVLQAIGASTP